MKESKTIRIEEILEELEKEERNNLEILIDECMKSICCEDIDWEAFQVYLPSKQDVKTLLENQEIEYLEVIADESKSRDCNCVKISIMHAKEKYIQTVKHNSNTLIAIIYVPKHELLTKGEEWGVTSENK